MLFTKIHALRLYHRPTDKKKKKTLFDLIIIAVAPTLGGCSSDVFLGVSSYTQVNKETNKPIKVP